MTTMISDIDIAGNESTPTIRSDWQAGLLAMQGDSYPENSYELFDNVIRWVRHFLDSEQRPLHLELALVYLNTSSVKAMMDIFDLLEDAFETGRQVSVTWHYDARNERIAELADEFREDCSYPFAITPAKDES
ncbi:biofilm regulation phosphoprotein SiaC [Billgrantia antri]|uniref:biofilm regulation phosphoprotein SiaC n=1 Tax=Billgrantia antri TaxID=2846777 RepID=UPI0023E03D7F|nr:biofilm regulation phosphoprotein SiaC [Halomonas sulfidivorans]